MADKNKVIQLLDPETGGKVSPVVNVGSIYDKKGQKIDNLLSYKVSGMDVPIPEIKNIVDDVKNSSHRIGDIVQNIIGPPDASWLPCDGRIVNSDLGIFNYLRTSDIHDLHDASRFSEFSVSPLFNAAGVSYNKYTINTCPHISHGSGDSIVYQIDSNFTLRYMRESEPGIVHTVSLENPYSLASSSNFQSQSLMITCENGRAVLFVQHNVSSTETYIGYYIIDGGNSAKFNLLEKSTYNNATMKLILGNEIDGVYYILYRLEYQAYRGTECILKWLCIDVSSCGVVTKSCNIPNFASNSSSTSYAYTMLIYINITKVDDIFHILIAWNYETNYLYHGYGSSIDSALKWTRYNPSESRGFSKILSAKIVDNSIYLLLDTGASAISQYIADYTNSSSDALNMQVPPNSASASVKISTSAFSQISDDVSKCSDTTDINILGLNEDGTIYHGNIYSPPFNLSMEQSFDGNHALRILRTDGILNVFDRTNKRLPYIPGSYIKVK